MKPIFMEEPPFRTIMKQAGGIGIARLRRLGAENAHFPARFPRRNRLRVLAGARGSVSYPGS
jgi:hypothetical protein